ncbi:MAG: hypothetical protein ACTSQ9_03915 [Candidatus Hodarchaeales archaeon]
MVDPLFLISSLLLAIVLIIILRITEGIPFLYIFFTVRKRFSVHIPEDYRLKADLIEFVVNERSQKAWFFAGENNPSTCILMIPDSTSVNYLGNSLRTAGILQNMNFNVLLPLVHECDLSSREVVKKTISTRNYQAIIDAAYKYLVDNENIDKRKIAIYSDSLGTVFTCSLVKNQLIKAVTIENGPVTLSTLITGKIPFSNIFSTLLSILIRILMWPVIWRTRWNSQRALSMLSSCPSFQISVFNLKDVPNKMIFQNYTSSYKPKQLWIEDALLPVGGIRNTWVMEYFHQIKHFYDRWLNDEQVFDWHTEMKVIRKEKASTEVFLKISVLPPVLEHFPLRVSLSDGKNQLQHKRVIFIGAEMKFEFNLNFRPKIVTILRYHNVSLLDLKSWTKLDAGEALKRNIETMTFLNLNNVIRYEKRYFMIKNEILQDIN